MCTTPYWKILNTSLESSSLSPEGCCPSHMCAMCPETWCRQASDYKYEEWDWRQNWCRDRLKPAVQGTNNRRPVSPCFQDRASWRDLIKTAVQICVPVWMSKIFPINQRKDICKMKEMNVWIWYSMFFAAWVLMIITFLVRSPSWRRQTRWQTWRWALGSSYFSPEFLLVTSMKKVFMAS